MATSGYEELAVVGARHEYPAETYGVVTAIAGCAWQLDHEILREHQDIYELCNADDRVDLTRWFAERTFLGRTLTFDYRCRDTTVLSPRMVPGGRSPVACITPEGDRASGSVEFLGREIVAIGAEAVEAARLRVRVHMTGRMRGEMTFELWLHLETGLPVRGQRTVDANVDTPLGARDYHEEFEFSLTSLRPRR